jgi:hypothetical protein
MWMRTNYRVPTQAICLTIDRSHSIFCPEWQKGLELLSEQPTDLAEFVKQFVMTARPELAGCCVLGFNFDLQKSQWLIVVSHGSLPAVDVFAELPTEPLFNGNSSAVTQTWRDREPLA